MSKPAHQWQASDPVSVLPGCGARKTQRLREMGIVTLQDLLRYQGTAPVGINIAQMRYLATSQLHPQVHPPVSTSTPPTPLTPLIQNNLTYSQHSWYHLVGHILHRSRAPTRVQIGPLMVTAYGVVLATTWFHRGTWKYRAVTPLMLACTFVLWRRREVVSDSSSEDEAVSTLDRAYLSADMDLPWFEVTGVDTLPANQSDMLKLAIREVNLYQQHSITLLAEP